MGMMRGGGGYAGKIDFPAYMRNFHDDYLLNNAQVIISFLLHGASPYNSAYAYDPDSDIDLVQDRIDTLNEAIDEINPSDDITSFVTDAAALVDDQMLPDDYITDLTAAYVLENKPAYLQGIAMVNAGMSDINAVHTSSFIIGMAIQEAQFANQTRRFTGELEARRDVVRFDAINNLTGQMVALYQLKLGLLNTVSGTQIEQGRFVVAAKQNQYDKDIELDVRDLFWDFDVLDRGGGVLGAINGAPSGANPPGPMQQMTSMGLSTLSSLIPLIGMIA